MARRALFALCLLLPSLACAEAGPGRLAFDRFLDGLDSLRASFVQSVLDTERAMTGEMHGFFFLQRPGRFRWDYVAPDRQVILADGRDVWFIDEELKQVTRHLQTWALKGTPAAFLVSDATIEDDFEVIEIGERLGMQWLELIPRDPDSDFNRVLLAFVGDELRHLELNDKFGQISRFRFYDIERNLPLDPSLFVYEGADDWDVLDAD
jgi:outer membrane lipoprotein carrier protein